MDNILAFGDLHLFEFDSEEPVIKIKGFTIKQKVFSGETKLCVDFPAYEVGKGHYQKSFILENKSHWKTISKLFLDEYKQQVGDIDTVIEDDINEIEVDPDEADKGIEAMRKQQS